MVIHDFIYEWDGKTKGREKPVSWWPGSYHVKIISMGAGKGNVSFLVPTIVLLKNAKLNPTMNTSLRNYIYSFAQKISKKYNLTMEKTLWVEIDADIRVIRIKPDPHFSKTIRFSIPWRPIRPNELDTIKPYLDDM